MKNHKELFIKYLDKQLSEEERSRFENQITGDKDLRMEYENFRRIFYSIKEVPMVNESYFNEIIPKARRRFDIAQNPKYYKYAFILPFLLLMFYLISQLSNTEYSYDFEYLFETFTKNEEIANQLFEYPFENLNFYYADIELSESMKSNLEIDESLFEYLAEKVRINEIDEVFYDQMTEEEFNEIYDELKKIKYIGEK